MKVPTGRCRCGQGVHISTRMSVLAWAVLHGPAKDAAAAAAALANLVLEAAE